MDMAEDRKARAWTVELANKINKVTMILIINPLGLWHNQDSKTQETMKMYFLSSEEIVNKNRRMIFKDHIHKS